MGLRRQLHVLVPLGALAALVSVSLAAPASRRASAAGTSVGKPASQGQAGTSRGQTTTTLSPGSTTTTLPPGSTTTTTAPAGPIQIENGGTATVAVPYLPSELNPATIAGANPVTAMIMAQVWPSPFVVGSGGNEVASTAFIDSAENVSVSPQKVVYTIDPKAVWSNGDPIDEADFVRTWQEQLAIGSSLPANDPLAGYEDIESITGAPQGKVVTVLFKRPYADWEDLFSELAPSAVATRYGWAKAFSVADPSHLVSGGPFEVSRVVPGKELVLSRNPDYWGPPAHLEQIVFKVVKGERAVIRGLEDGAVDVARLLPGPAIRDLETIDRGIGGATSLSPTLWQLELNLANPLVGQLAVRRAIALSIDRVELAADSVGLLKADLPTSGNHLYLSGASGSVGNDGAYAAVDVPLADELLGGLGYHLGADGLLRNGSGRELVLRLAEPTGNLLVSEMTAELRVQLLDAGIVVRIDRMPLARLLAKVLPTGSYQLALAPTLVSPFPSENATYYEDPVGPTPSSNPFSLPSPPGSTTTTTTTLPAGTPGPVQQAYLQGVASRLDPGAVRAGTVARDVLGYDDPAVDSLLTQAFSDLNPITMSRLYNEADQRLWSDLPSVPLYQVPSALLGERSLLNLHDSPTWMGPLWNAENWAIKLTPPPPVTTTTTTPGS